MSTAPIPTAEALLPVVRELVGETEFGKHRTQWTERAANHPVILDHAVQSLQRRLTEGGSAVEKPGGWLNSRYLILFEEAHR